MRILVVEDQALIALTLAEALKEAGHEVIGPAVRSEQALSLARARRPELALVDIDLDYAGEGLELASELYALGSAVLFMTGRADLARTHPLALGVMVKPFSLTSAVAAVSIAQGLLAGESDPPIPPIELRLFSPPANPLVRSRI